MIETWEGVCQDAIADLAPIVGITKACKATGYPRARWSRRHRISEPPPRPAPIPHADRAYPSALTPAEQHEVYAVLTSARFADASPAHIWATLLDEGTYLCSQATVYRLIRHRWGAATERRAQARHPAKKQPELMASGPNQVWSWDITKLRGPGRGRYFHLYAIIDIYSRYVVGWTVQERESAALAEAMITATVAAQEVEQSQLTLHSDNGPSMAAKPVAFLLEELGVTKSHSRPHTSNDNPYSEACFKTVKYCPDFPESFASLQEARTFATEFFTAYNSAHPHSGIALLTPEVVHHGRAEAVIDHRDAVLDKAYHTNPHRFRRRPRHPRLPTQVWINHPEHEPPTNPETAKT